MASTLPRTYLSHPAARHANCLMKSLQRSHAYAEAGFGATTGGRSKALISDWNCTRRWLPSQKGLFSECPHRHKLTDVRPAKPKAFPS